MSIGAHVCVHIDVSAHIDGYPDPIGWAAQVRGNILVPHPMPTCTCVCTGKFKEPVDANLGDRLMLIVSCQDMSLSSTSKQKLFGAILVISFVFEPLRILVIGSRAGRTRFPSDSAQSMERGSKRDLEKLSTAIREINKKIGSQRAGGGSSADSLTTDGRLSWPFCVRAALCVWAVTLNVDGAIQFLNEWGRQRKEKPPWSQEQLKEEVASLTDFTKDVLVNPPTKRGKLALAEAYKFVRERSLFQWVRAQNRSKGLAPSYAALWRQWAHAAEAEVPDAGPDTAGFARSAKHKAQRMRRWARRWIVVRGCYKPGPRLELDRLRSKAICVPRGC